MVKLSKEEKTAMCAELTAHLPKLRKMLNLTQEDLGNMSGLSRVTISQIEGGKVKMNWLHLNAIIYICNANVRTKEYFYANNLLGPRFLQFMQRKDENEYPEINILIDVNKVKPYKDIFTYRKNRLSMQ
jgi:DNA-binding XRE family transcriptional regulator